MSNGRDGSRGYGYIPYRPGNDPYLGQNTTPITGTQPVAPPGIPARPFHQTPVRPPSFTFNPQNQTRVPNQTPIPRTSFTFNPENMSPVPAFTFNPENMSPIPSDWRPNTSPLSWGTAYTPQGLTFSTELPPLDPAAMEAYRARRAAAQAAYDQVISDVNRGRRSARTLMRQTTRNIARQAAGSGQDLRSNLGSTGLQESPGVIGPAIDYVNAAAARERAAARRSFADTMAGLRQERAQAGIARRQSLADLMAWKVNQQQQQLETEWEKMINEYNYGGGAQ